MGSDCGAVTGAIMVIGMKHGKTRDDDSRADNETFKRIAKFVQEFKAKHEHTDCSVFLGTDMGTQEGVSDAAGKGNFQAVVLYWLRQLARFWRRCSSKDQTS